MHNKFLEELAHKPIANTFKLSYKMFWSNKFLFTVMTIIFIFFSILEFTIPLTFAKDLAEISMAFMIFVIALINIIPPILTQSNYLFICKMVLESDSDEECVSTMASTKVSAVFTNYFVRALGSSLAIVLIVTPFIAIREELYMGEYWDMFLMLLLLLALYVYPIVAYKLTLSKNVNEAFIATFLLFSPAVWRQSFNLAYAKFVISIMMILSGVFLMLSFGIENVSDMGNTDISIAIMVIMTTLSMFVALYVLPVAMMIAHSISEDKKDK